MILIRFINKFLLLIGIKSYRWKLAICSKKGKKIEIIKIFNPGFFEFWADPFFVKFKKKKYIFFEIYNYLKKKGEISCVEILNNNIINKKKILELNYHLSYPNIFKHKKNFYLIPESYENNKTTIYKSIKFPYKWKKLKTLFHEKKICDTTVLAHNKKLWLFFNKAEKNINEFNKKLYIYKSKDYNFSKIVSHKKNPVINNLYSSRSAGSFFKEKKNLIRPAQINKKNIYGYGLSLNKVVKLDLNRFEQVEILRITPKSFNNKNICGVHHYSKISDELFLTDLCFRFSF